MRATPNYPFLLVAVTGGIGSGKSTVCGLFLRLGRTIIPADSVARNISDEDPDVKKAIRSTFGPAAYLPDGNLDRKWMADQVFADRRKRQVLDSIVHPYVFKEIDRQLDSLRLTLHQPYVLIEAALVFETGMDTWMDQVIVVTAEEETRIQRVMKRDSVSREDVVRRIRAQIPMAKKIRLADFVIMNNGDVSELDATVMFVDGLLSHMGGVGKS